ISLLCALAATFGGARGWGLLGDRYYGPISATNLGPICVAGVLSGCVLFRLEKRLKMRAMISVGSLFLVILLILSRARGSYAACGAGLLSLLWMAAWRRSFAHVACAMGATLLIATGLLLLHTQDVSRSNYAHFLRLDSNETLDTRIDIWKA